jgi:superkiller protein 3
MGRGDEAVAVFADLAARRPEDAYDLSCYGCCLTCHRRREAAAILDRAVIAGRAAIRLKPDEADAHFNLGHALEHQGLLDEAIAEYRAAIGLNSNDGAAHIDLGVALEAQGKLDEAIAEFRASIRLEPDDGQAHNNLGAALFVQGKLDRAIAEARATIRLEPDLVQAHHNLGLSRSLIPTSLSPRPAEAGTPTSWGTHKMRVRQEEPTG